MLTIAVTGHRKLLNEKAVRREITLSLGYFKAQYPSILALSALATGADTIFAQEAHKAGASLRVILPFALAEYQKDFDEDERVELEALLKKASQPYEVVNTLGTHTANERNEAYLSTGKKMVDKADVILAIWDGEPANGKGGTGDIVQYARQQGKEVHIISGIRDANALPDEVETKFNGLDTDAITYKKHRFERVWGAGLACAVLAVFFFAIGLVFRPDLLEDTRFFLACMEVIFIGISAVALLGFAKRWKKQFLDYRRNAEYLRIVLWYREAGIPIPPLEEARYEQLKYEVSRDVLDLEQKVAASIGPITNFSNAKRKAWCLAEDQIRYHRHTRIDTFEESEKQLETSLGIIKYGFFSSVGVKFIAELQEYLGNKAIHIPLPELHGLMPILNGLVIVLPPLYAALEGIKFFGEWKHNIAISGSIITQLKTSKDRIMACKDEKTLLAETTQLRYVLEIENSDWANRYHQKVVEVVM